MTAPMFFLTYLRGELRGRCAQAVLTAAGLAIGVGLVLTVVSASRGVRQAQARALHSLYGIGTDLTVAPPARAPAGRSDQRRGLAGRRADILSVTHAGLLGAQALGRIAHLPHVAAAAGALTLTDTALPKDGGLPVVLTIDGLDLARPGLGPFGSARLTSGRAFAAADSHARVAVVDASYARANKLAVGSSVTIGGARFTVIRIVSQSPADAGAQIYIPLASAQALAQAAGAGSLTGKIDLIYVRAASAAEIPAVLQEISRLLPSASVTSASNLAGVITGSLANAARLATNLGKDVAGAALLAAIAAASLLMSGAVGRRTRELGTLKALGWRTRRIVAQIIAEAATVGVIGAGIGVALGGAGVAAVDAVAPTLTAAITQAQGVEERVAVRLSAGLTVGTMLVSVALALGGALISGAVGAWRAARMRPADALAQLP